MRICLLGDISGRLDEGMKNTTNHYYIELSRTNDVLLVRPKRLASPQQWKEVVLFAPQVIHYIHGPTIRSFILTKILSLLCPKAVTVMSATRPILSKWGWRVIPFLKPNLLLVQSSKQGTDFGKLGFRTSFFPGGIDTGQFHPVSETKKRELRKKFRIPIDKFVVLHVGHITRMRSLEVFDRIARINNCFIYIVAATSWVAPDESLLLQLERAGCFINTNFIPDIEQVYQMSDCYVFPGFSESPSIEIPLSVLEAMACNVPVVSGRFGGLSDLFADGDGFYFADSADEILQSLNRILHSHSEKFKTRKMVNGLSWKSLAKELIKIYQGLVSERAK